MIDYRIQYDKGLGDGSWHELVSGLTSTSYTAVGLQRGTTYAFVVQSRNLYGYSSYSAQKNILAAQQPDTPTGVTTTVEGSLVTISWQLTSNGGSAITAYRVYVRQQDGVTFSQDLTDCNGSDSQIIADQVC